MGPVVVTGCFKYIVKALFLVISELSISCAWFGLWGSTRTSVSPHSVGSQAAGPEMMVRFLTESWQVLKMLSRFQKQELFRESGCSIHHLHGFGPGCQEG